MLGLNGSGKSTLLKIIAGLDQNYEAPEGLKTIQNRLPAT
ncbi:MAG: ATP-binding cassette domain-containing protein [Saprospiraceae bacterium]